MFCKRDSGGNLIVAWHHPRWSLTWSWGLRWNKRSGGQFIYGFRTYRDRGWYGRIGVGRLTFERQPTMRLDRCEPL